MIVGRVSTQWGCGDCAHLLWGKSWCTCSRWFPDRPWSTLSEFWDMCRRLEVGCTGSGGDNISVGIPPGRLPRCKCTGHTGPWYPAGRTHFNCSNSSSDSRAPAWTKRRTFFFYSGKQSITWKRKFQLGYVTAEEVFRFQRLFLVNARKGITRNSLQYPWNDKTMYLTRTDPL